MLICFVVTDLAMLDTAPASQNRLPATVAGKPDSVAVAVAEVTAVAVTAVMAVAVTAVMAVAVTEVVAVAVTAVMAVAMKGERSGGGDS